MIDYAARLDAALKHAKMDVPALAKSLGITYQGVKRVADGKSKAFSATNHERTAAILGVSSLWLATGEGLMKDGDAPRETATAPNTPEVIQNVTDDEDSIIRQLDTGGSMGGGFVLADQPGVIKEWRVSDRWMHENVHRVTSAKNLRIVTGFGLSMQPMFNPGDPLLVDCGITRPDVDGIYFFRVGDEGYVKQIQRIPTESGTIYRAKSHNEKFDPFDITPGMDFQVFGRVVKVWKSEEVY